MKLSIKRAIYFSVIGLVLSMSSTALAEQDAKSALQAKLMQLKSYIANFEQTVTDANGEVLQQAKGQIIVQQPQRLRWEVLPPDEGVLIADGKTLWHVDPFVEQVIALDQSQAVNDHPIMLLAEPNSALWRDYKVSYADGTYSVTPIKQPQSVKQFQLMFNKADVLTGIEILDQQDQRNQLQFRQIQSNAHIAKGVFEFSVPEGFELDDQR
ncbi:outer membrane lipoprotein chaperone LolA [Alteromonas sp. a30]|uniref:outer membrane lipoprotein chaperone LolA n=1 Tax=Alteromonas sp. a30 TaxID=2730917 RepID=UPI0022817C72|nr:outer membrane lipoprotein chaperone LolA [Alteromonas sp. a30]MCY7295126.1 outer membrane lipoprotein chaperone LolA [Alteromonas sp. a30]